MEIKPVAIDISFAKTEAAELKAMRLWRSKPRPSSVEVSNGLRRMKYSFFLSENNFVFLISEPIQVIFFLGF